MSTEANGNDAGRIAKRERRIFPPGLELRIRIKENLPRATKEEVQADWESFLKQNPAQEKPSVSLPLHVYPENETRPAPKFPPGLAKSIRLRELRRLRLISQAREITDDQSDPLYGDILCSVKLDITDMDVRERTAKALHHLFKLEGFAGKIDRKDPLRFPFAHMLDIVLGDTAIPDTDDNLVARLIVFEYLKNRGDAKASEDKTRQLDYAARFLDVELALAMEDPEGLLVFRALRGGVRELPAIQRQEVSWSLFDICGQLGILKEVPLDGKPLPPATLLKIVAGMGTVNDDDNLVRRRLVGGYAEKRPDIIADPIKSGELRCVLERIHTEEAMDDKELAAHRLLMATFVGSIPATQRISMSWSLHLAWQQGALDISVLENGAPELPYDAVFDIVTGKAPLTPPEGKDEGYLLGTRVSLGAYLADHSALEGDPSRRQVLEETIKDIMAQDKQWTAAHSGPASPPKPAPGLLPQG